MIKTINLKAIMIGILMVSFVFFGLGIASANAFTMSEIDGICVIFSCSTTQRASLEALATDAGTTSTTTLGAYSGLLKKGSKGTAVSSMQQVLLDLGYNLGSYGADGSFGSMTVAAIKAYQANKGLTADGVVGPATWASLQASSGVVTPAPAPTPTGSMSVGLAVDNPAATTYVATQATADLAHFTFTGSGTVTNLVFQRIGVSGDTTPSNIYLFDGVTRLTDAASATNTGTVTFNDPSGIFTVSSSKTISIKSDILTGTSGQTLGMKLVSYTVSGATAATTVNISGNLHAIASATLASITAGTVTPSGATVNPGADITLWQSTLTTSTRDITMKKFALRNIGSAPAGSFANFKLYVGGTQVATASGLDSDGYVTFDMTSAPVTLSASKIVRVDGDIVSGASRTVQLSLRNAADIDLYDSSFGVTIVPTSTPWTPSSASTISGSSGGTLTIAKDLSSPSTNLVDAASDSILGIFKVTAYGEPIKIGTIRATFTSSDATITQLRNGRILIGGTQYGSTATLNEDSHGTLAYTSYTLNYTVNPGTPVLLEIRADIFDNDGTNSITAGTDTVNGTIAIGSSNAQRIDSLGSFNAPSSATASNTLTVASTAITLSKNSTYANQNTTLPMSAYKIGAWNIVGSSAEGVTISTLSFDVDEVTVSADDFNESDITNMYVVIKDSAGNIVAQPSPLSTVSATDNNYSLNYNLAKNTSARIELYGDLGSTVTVGEKFKTDLTVTGTSDNGTAVTATSADTDGQTFTYAAATIIATIDASSPVVGIVYDNQTVTSAAYKFVTTTSPFVVTDVTLTVGAGAATAVSYVMLYDGTTLLKTISGGSTTMTFTGLNFNVPANSSKVLTVKYELVTVGPFAGTSGSSLATTMTVFTSTTGGVSDASANDSGQSQENNPASAITTVLASVPTINITPYVGTSTSLTNGTNKNLIKFTITANGGPIEWNFITLKVVKDDATTVATGANAGIALYDVTNGGNTLVAGTFVVGSDVYGAAVCTGGGATCDIKFTPTAVESITTAKTYELRATIAASGAAGDFVSVTLDNDTTDAFVALDQVTDIDADTDAPIIWSDLSEASHATTTDDWTSEFGIKSLPISQTLNYSTS